MYRGNDLWPSEMTSDLIKTTLSNGRTIETFPGLPKNMYQSFLKTSYRRPNKVALIDHEGNRYTYQDLRNKVRDFSGWLYRERKIRRGEHVALMLQNRMEFAIAALSLNRIGAVIVSLPSKYKEAEIRALVEKADLQAVITEDKYQSYFSIDIEQGLRACVIPDDGDYGLRNYIADAEAELAVAEEETDAADLALMMFTSGTTSHSKGVTIRNYNIVHAMEAYRRTLGITEDDRAILPVPIYLITGLVAIFGLMMHVGGMVVLNRTYKAKRVLEDIEKYQITFFHASPTVFTLLLQERDNYPSVPSLRMFACGSSNMAPGKIRALKEWIPNSEFRTIYGLTETTSPGTVFPMDANDSDYIGSSGIPIPGMEVKVIDDDGEEVPDGTEGTVCVKGTNITEEYYKLDNGMIRDGWLDTGDIGYVNADGFLYIVDRKKDMINRGGEKVCSFDIENELSHFEEVADAAVVGVPHELYGEVPVAVVKLKDGAACSGDELKERLRTRMAKYKVPEEIRIVDEIPITANMKTNKRQIRQMFAKEDL